MPRRKASDECSIPKGFQNSGAASPVRMYCPGVAGWWCARSLPGRRLRGACGGRHSSGLGRRRLHRGHQLGDHRRKRTGRTGCQAASLLAGDHRQPASRLGCRAQTLTPKGDLPRALFNQFSAACALVTGAPGFFSLRQPAPWLHPNGALEGTSFYETKRLKSTLERLVDFDRINAGDMRFSVGAVNVRTGNLVYFDNRKAYDPARARDGQRIASARLSCGRDRR